MQLDLTRHHRRIGLHSQAQQIFDPRLVDGYIEVDVASRLALDAHHIPPGDEGGMQEPGLHRLQVGISIGAIHDGVEIGVQWHLVPADFYLEIRSVGLAIDHDLVQRALVLPLRGKDSANALDRAQVRIMEGIGAP
jgi:hypothetical protein